MSMFNFSANGVPINYDIISCIIAGIVFLITFISAIMTDIMNAIRKSRREKNDNQERYKK